MWRKIKLNWLRWLSLETPDTFQLDHLYKRLVSGPYCFTIYEHISINKSCNYLKKLRKRALVPQEPHPWRNIPFSDCPTFATSVAQRAFSYLLLRRVISLTPIE